MDHASVVRFGMELQRLRTAADLSQRQLGRRIGTSGQQVGAVERADRRPSKRLAELADRELDARGSLLKLWPGATPTYPRWLEAFVELEAKAEVIQEFQAQAVPGLLQTERYAWAVLGASWPPKREKEANRLLQGRIERQKILNQDNPPLLWVVIEEGVLHRPVGGPEVMREQLRVLLSAMDRPSVRLQVLPFGAGAHSAMNGSFVVLDMNAAESLVYAEIPGAGHVITEASIVANCARRFGALCGLALSPEETRAVIAARLGEEDEQQRVAHQQLQR